MGKKSANPADAFRKAQRAKELKKNKEDRKKKRDDKNIKRDTRDLEAEIRELKNAKESDGVKERLKALETELKYVNKAKEKYVADHPDAKDRVFHTGKHAPSRPRDDDEQGGRPDPMAHLYNPDGTLRDPKRSVYYDPTYNPFGVPPPGMPYRERTPPPGESSDSDDSDEDDSDDDIVMPEGPPPGQEDSDNDSDDSDDIPLPTGPPPPRPGQVPAGLAPPPPTHAAPVGWGGLMPQPPRPVGAGAGRGRGGARGGMGGRGGPPRPPTLPAAPSSLPAKPGSEPAVAAAAAPKLPSVVSKTAAPTAATISAAPQLRDFRKESTVFVPRNLAKKKAPSGLAPVNAAPNSGVVDADGDEVRVQAPSGPGLLGKLSNVLGGSSASTAATDAEDEYARFLEGLD